AFRLCGASPISAFAVLRVNDSLRRLPTSTAMSRCAAILIPKCDLHRVHVSQASGNCLPSLAAGTGLCFFAGRGAGGGHASVLKFWLRWGGGGNFGGARWRRGA